MFSCGSKNEGTQEISYADRLYASSIKLAKLYRDSVARATDSASTEQLFSNFNMRHTELVFSFPADTELTLSETQNDTIFEQFVALRALYNRKLQDLAYKAEPDTVPN